MKTLTILSGKGGVGKSSLTASLAVLLSRKKRLIAVDCDVDAPNLGLVLGLKKFSKNKKLSTNEKAKLISMKDIDAKKVVDICNFDAISYNGKKLIFNRFLCEGCGSCHLLYPKNIRLEKVENAIVSSGKTKYGFKIVSGELKMGESGSGKVIDEIKEMAREIKDIDIMLIDASPGVSCPVIAAIRGSDYVIAITEPTPSALSDLKRVLKLVEHFKIPYGLVINRFDLNKNFSKKIVDFAESKKIPILGKIPYDKKFVDALVKLIPIVVYNKKYEVLFSKILNKIKI